VSYASCWSGRRLEANKCINAAISWLKLGVKKQRKPVAGNHRPTGRDALADDVDFGGLGGILSGLIRLFI
jgi:hypothetical protein